MAKREIPLIIIDREKSHHLGECDFVVCTDVNNGFVARVEPVECEPCNTDMVTTSEERNGLRARMEIKRIIGDNPDTTTRRNLLRKAMEVYSERTTVRVDIDDPTDEECIKFLDVLINSNKKALDDAGVDYNERKIVMSSLAILEAIRNKLKIGETSYDNQGIQE